ncbi:hypothetical protein AURDEDRAFT_177088 [Auricularia subglabra TFB-10046 SS5]|uniref:Uncharacterized protein n=1 Tax=Auricularia subglabra (strain TFB-10046 / SS5) TaxID=717982 RepID=J0LBL2_AURST|nr:hypothetical protein AURDEDRAFT_177088 [Auricularia subglabra TFB-10046 SS5]
MNDNDVRSLDTEIRFRDPPHDALFRALFVGAGCSTTHGISVPVDHHTASRIRISDLLVYQWLFPSITHDRDRVREGRCRRIAVSRVVRVPGQPPHAYSLFVHYPLEFTAANGVLERVSHGACSWKGDVLIVKHAGPDSDSAPTHLCSSDDEFALRLAVRVLTAMPGIH